MQISNSHENIIVMNSIDTRFFRNVFEAVQKTQSTYFIGSKPDKPDKPDKTLLLVFQTLRGVEKNSKRFCRCNGANFLSQQNLSKLRPYFHT